ncbi:hypothetical protein [Dyadobacter endophyticus]|uniref:hypothetical protein n=1 Tax=Dyadobacter endophyticus TaxID=1749036 RepID=UPI0016664E53|nr:hypothetical protein [Dyadobacter endophyticus]
MSLLEWLFESFNPGPVGKIEVHQQDPDDNGRPPKKWLIYVVTLIGLFFAGLCFYLIFHNRPHDDVGTIIVRLCYFSIYVMASHFFDATPEPTNMGWVSGLIDNPFRISEDYNRLLLFFQVVLLPGKLIAFSLIIGWLLSRQLFRAISNFTATFRGR